MKTTRKPAEQTLDRPGSEKQEWSKLYILAEHWQSDLKFFQEELRFLHRIIKRFLLWLNEDENILSTRSLVNRITETEKERHTLDEHVSKHMMHIREIMENPFVYNESKVTDEHVRLEVEFSDFVKNFRKLKGQVFTEAERVIEKEEELNRFLGT
jgi:hypothetical protein